MHRVPIAALLVLALIWASDLEGAAAGVSREGPPATGTITGIITDGRTGGPLSAAQVSIIGTQIGTLSGQDGRYTLQNVPAGTLTVRVQRIGMTTEERSVSVVSGESVTLDFELGQRPLDLDGIVVTGTAGGTQRRAIGNVVATVNADDVMATSPVGSVDQLLAQRTPGMMMMPGTGQVGTGTAPRIRGVGSITQGNDPIIYIDGVRMDGSPNRGPGQRGGANISRLNDIHPADIESIEVIKGPAAATLYGTEASNGVIQIITKRGQTGRPQFDLTARLGTNWMWNPEGRTDMRYRWADPANPGGELIGMNIYEHERINGDGPIFGYGALQSYNLSMRGGTDVIRYFGSVSLDDNVGIVDWNTEQRYALRGNVESIVTDQLTVAIRSAFISGSTRLAQGSIETDPFSNLIWANPYNLEDGRRGWRAAPPEEWRKVVDRGDIDRSTSSIELRYRPVTWSTHRLVAGLDNTSSVNSSLTPQQPEGANHYYGNRALGQKSVNRGTRKYFTLDYAGSADFDWNDFSFQPSIGLQYSNSRNASINASGSQFPAIPITTISGGAIRDSGESFSEESMVGFYAQQQVGLNNRAFLTAAVRLDSHSAFGVDASAAIYPKLSGTWVISEEDFWPLPFVEQLRLRGAFGAAGQQPGTFAASRLYNPAIGYQDNPALSPGSFGNPDLKPERGEELEIGFDASFLDGRVNLEVTRYQKVIKDAIINRPLAPSSGFTGSQIVNIGRIEASGNEIGMSARLIEGNRFDWEIDSQISTMGNTIKSLGGLDVIYGGTQSQHREDYSIADIFMIRVLDAEIDANGNVLSATCDGGTGPQGVHPGGAAVPCMDASGNVVAPQVWYGNSQPTWQFGFGNTFTLFTNLRLYARVEGNGGHIQNNTEIRATHNQGTTEAVLRGDNPLVQAYRTMENDRMGLYDAGFLRLREISANYDLPEALVRRVGGQRGSLGLGVRNVAMLWTAQHGWSTPRDGHIKESLTGQTVWDPEVRGTGSNSVQYQTVLPPTASATLTLRMSF